MKKWILVIPLTGVLLFVGARDGHTLTARGTIAGHTIDTTVDHDVARAYVVGDALPRPLALERQTHLLGRSIPSREELAHIARSYSSDVAALLFMETVAVQERNRLVQAESQCCATVRSSRRSSSGLGTSILVGTLRTRLVLSSEWIRDWQRFHGATPSIFGTGCGHPTRRDG